MESFPAVVLDTDWETHPPKEIWRRKVGPGWSSFAVAGRSLFTQEQRGDSEVIACYDADTAPADGFTNRPPASGNPSPGPARGQRPRSRTAGCLPSAEPVWCIA